MKVTDQVAQENEIILSRVEAMGGGFVWEQEIFTVTLIEIPAMDSEVAILQRLRGVQQIALNASNLSYSAIEAIAHIPGLESLVLSQAPLSKKQHQALQVIGPEILFVISED